PRGQDGDARDPDPAALDPRLHRDRRGDPARPGGFGKLRPAWLQRDHVCLRVRHRQQWQRLCRPYRQQPVLQHDDRPCDAGRPVRDDCADDGGRGLARGEEDRAAVQRHLPHHQPALGRPPGRRHPDRRRPDLLPGTRLGPDRRAPRNERRHLVLILKDTIMTATTLSGGKIRKRSTSATLTDPKILIPAIAAAFRKLDPRLMMKNPVIFVVEVVTMLTTMLFIRDLVTGAGNTGFSFQINLWLWFTVLFANFAEAAAEGRGKAQAATLRKTKTDTVAKLLDKSGSISKVSATALKVGDVVLVEAGDII